MTEEEAQRWMADHYGTEACQRVATFLDRVLAENNQQNLISPTTAQSIWARHAVDSAQLLALAPPSWKTWVDIGTGGGFPGMIVALLAPERQVVMVEPRAKRAGFLRSCVSHFGLRQAVVHCSKIQGVQEIADVISARAVAPIEKLLHGARHCANDHTTWLLPRGRSGIDTFTWEPMFHVEHSITDPASTVCVGRGCLR